MGKQRRQRTKLHIPAKNSQNTNSEPSFLESELLKQPLMKLEGNIFEGININMDSLNKKLSDDVQSVKSSFTSVKPQLVKTVSKKEKLKLRRQMFLKKFEVMQQMKKEKQLLKKRESTPVVGDMNPLHDALPSLESLLKNRTNIPYKAPQPKKMKGIEKLSKQKKNQLQGIKTFQQIFKNKQFQKDPQSAISKHIKNVLEHEKTDK